ncbi:WD40 repeat domain-containing protein, partial [archaeon]
MPSSNRESADIQKGLHYTKPPARGSSIVAGITLQRTLHGHTSSINRIAWSPDGLLLASPSSDGTVRIWNTQTGECIRVLQMGGSITTITWSPDSKIAAFASKGTTIFLWEAEKNPGITSFTTPYGGDVYMLAWSPNSDILASASRDGSIRLWDKQQELSVQSTSQTMRAAAALCLDWSPDGKYIVFGGFSGHITLLKASYYPNYYTTTLQTHEHTKSVTCVAWSPDGRHFASASEDKRVLIWKADGASQPFQVLERHSHSVTCVAFSSDGKWMASKDSREVVLWRCDT